MMYKGTITAIVILVSIVAHGQTDEAQIRNVLTQQFEAFNDRDVDRLVDNVTDDFKWFYITADTLLLEVSGKQQFRASMESYYHHLKAPLTSSAKDFTVHNNKISFKEVVEYTNNKGEMVKSAAMGIYEIRNNKISRAWYFID